MIWAFITAVFSLLLCIKLVFFTDCDRIHSRLVYRLFLYLLTLAIASRLVGILYAKSMPGPVECFITGVLLFGSFFVKAENLPWNHVK